MSNKRNSNESKYCNVIIELIAFDSIIIRLQGAMQEI